MIPEPPNNSEENRSSPLQSHTLPDRSPIAPPEAIDPLWNQMLDSLPFGVALLEARTGCTLWLSATLQRMLLEKVGALGGFGLEPTQYLPLLNESDWSLALEQFSESGCPSVPSPPGRLQFVDHTTREISYWEWNLQRLISGAAPTHVLLVVREMSEAIMTERLLASTGRTAKNARQRAEEALSQLRAAQTQLVQVEKLRAIGELASGIAHDFNNALQAILGYAELAQESMDDPAAVKEDLRIIIQAAEDATNMVRRLQMFARQKVVTEGEATSVNRIVQDVIELTRPRWRDAAQREGYTFHVQADLRPLPLLLAEPSGLREMLLNLTYNALNAMPEGGSLRFATRVAGDFVEIEIADTGIGMTEAVQARIFDPFFTTRGVEGTGLGLSVSWTIVQRHGGSIRVESAPGQGTLFVVSLPIGDVGVQTRPEDTYPTAPGVPGASLLIVDDEPFIASLLASLLRREGYRTKIAYNAQEGLEYLSTGAEVDLLITDHGMPGINGLQMLAEVRQRRPGLPCLLLTGWGDALLDTHDSAHVPEAVLSKPINRADLLNMVDRLLAHSSDP